MSLLPLLRQHPPSRTVPDPGMGRCQTQSQQWTSLGDVFSGTKLPEKFSRRSTVIPSCTNIKGRDLNAVFFLDNFPEPPSRQRAQATLRMADSSPEPSPRKWAQSSLQTTVELLEDEHDTTDGETNPF